MKVAIVITIPPVLVLASSVVTVPIAFIIAASLVTRTHPAGACVRRPGPVALMPDIAPVHRIPIPIDPRVTRAGDGGRRHCDGRRRGRTDRDADPNGREQPSRCQ